MGSPYTTQPEERFELMTSAADLDMTCTTYKGQFTYEMINETKQNKRYMPTYQIK